MSKALRTTRMNAWGPNRDGDYIHLMTGVRGSTVGSANGGVSLAIFRTLTPFGTTVDGVFTADNILSVNAVSTGIATWFRLTTTSGGTAYQDGLVSAPGGGGDLIIGDVNIVIGEPVDFVQWVETEGNAD